MWLGKKNAGMTFSLLQSKPKIYVAFLSMHLPTGTLEKKDAQENHFVNC